MPQTESKIFRIKEDTLSLSQNLTLALDEPTEVTIQISIISNDINNLSHMPSFIPAHLISLGPTITFGEHTCSFE